MEYQEMVPTITQFQGEKVINGKKHNLIDTYCNKCGDKLSSYHFGCCGHAMNGTHGLCKCSLDKAKNPDKKEP